MKIFFREKQFRSFYDGRQIKAVLLTIKFKIFLIIEKFQMDSYWLSEKSNPKFAQCLVLFKIFSLTSDSHVNFFCEKNKRNFWKMRNQKERSLCLKTRMLSDELSDFIC